MPQTERVTAERILHSMLDRHEQPKGRTRDITHPIDYRCVGGPADQDEFHRVLRDAERTGAIALEKNALGRLTGELARIRLLDAGRLYIFLVREPAGVIAERALQTIAANIPDALEDPVLRTIVSEAGTAWATGKSFIGLTPKDVGTFETVLRLAHGIMHLRGRDIDHRTFSRRVVKDSKALEASEGRVAQLLKRWNVSLAGMKPREVLEACGIVRRAHPLFVKGPLSIDSDGIKLEGTGQLFVGLTVDSARKAALSRPVEYVITIENPTSFWRYCGEIGGDYLALLTDGFPARDVLAGMTNLVKTARVEREVPVFHWGDIDAGGVRIAAHLEDAFGLRIRLHQMDASLACALGQRSRSRQGLNGLAERPGPLGNLARFLTSADARELEQEELDPQAPELRNPMRASSASRT